MRYNKLVKCKIHYTIVTFSLILFIIILDTEDLRKYLWLFYLIQYLFAIRIVKGFSNKNFFYLSPSFLLVTYVNLNLIFGSYALNHYLSIDVYQYRAENFNHLSNIHFISIYYIICSLISILALQEINYSKKRIIESSDISHGSFGKIVAICTFLILFFSIVNLDLSFIGGSSSGFNTIPRTIAAIIIFYESAKRKSRYRYIYYIGIIILLTSTNYDSKREVFFLIFPILLLEIYFHNWNISKINLKKILLLSLSIVIFIYLILVMTIFRGYGQYPFNSKLNAISYVPNLIHDNGFLNILASTSETTTFTYVSYRSINYVLIDNNLLSWGMTYFKLLFAFLPGSIKPLSMTSTFTKIEDFGFYQIGGSLPVNIFAEAFWNFHLMGLLFILLLVYLLNTAFYSLFFKKQRLSKPTPLLFTFLYAYAYLLGFYRGFSFDLYFVLIFVSFFFSWLFYKIIYSKLKVRMKKH